VYELIKANKRRSVALIVGFVVVLTLVGTAFGFLFDGGIVADDYQVSGIINGDGSGADLAVGCVLLLLLAATVASAAACASETSEAAEASKTAGAATALLRVNRQSRGAQAHTQDTAEIFFPSELFHGHSQVEYRFRISF
jgi:type IV secretory pathway TrbL component